MTPGNVPPCLKCKHFEVLGWRCPAFPNQAIPEPIRLGADPHRTEYPGQVPGILFEPRNPTDGPLDRRR